MSPQPFPDADYPTAFDEADMVKAPDVPVNAGVDEVQSIFNDATGGDFALLFDGEGPTTDLPYNAEDDSVAAQGTLIIEEAVTEGDQFTLDAQQYTLKASPTTAYDIAIGADEAATKVNIVAAINASGTEGVEYFAGTLEHPTVVATAFAVDDCVLTAKTSGTVGNSIVSDETGQGLTDVANVFDDTTLGTTTAGTNGIVTEFERLANVDDVSVTGDGTSGDPWLLTFEVPGSTDVPLITADDSGLTGETVGTTIAEEAKGGPVSVFDVPAGQGPL
jgi:hypothetical protein